MNTTKPISEQLFLKRLTNLCLRSGLSGFPKDDTDQHILLKSAALTLDPATVYTEAEINELLKVWINQIAGIEGIDHGTLRRRLIDSGYLERDKTGSSYQISASGPRVVQFEAPIEAIDPRQALEAARQEIEARKRAYLQKANKQTK